MLASLCVCACAATPPSEDERAQTDLPRRILDVAGHQAEVQVADTAETRQKGLMYRRVLAANEGMLLVFADDGGRRCLWMQNAPLPLSAAFVDKEGTVVHTVDMQPESSDIHCSPLPAAYAWEMPQGWFAARGIGQGSKVGNLPAPSGF